MKMSNIRHCLLWLSVVSALCLFSSCDPDDEAWGLTGYWSYQGDSNGYGGQADYNEFYFAPNGTGTYSCYADNGFGPWTTYNITWWASGGYLTIQVDGWDQWDYRYDVTPGWLYLYPDYGGPYLIYRSN